MADFPIHFRSAGIIGVCIALFSASFAGAATATVVTGGAVTLSVSVSGTPPFSYQWYKNGSAISGAVAADYTIGAAQPTDAGEYYVVVGNPAGSTTSDQSLLAVVAAGPSPFLVPTSIARDRAGNLFVTDSAAETVLKISPTGAAVVLAGTAGLAGETDGSASTARFNSPAGVAVGSDGTVYIADKGNAVIRMVNTTGVVSTLAGSAARGNQDGVGTAASFSSPIGIALDTSGNLYVADAFNDTIRKVTPAGAVITFAGSPGNPGETNGVGSAARFSSPGGVAVDAAGIVYVADTNNDALRMIEPDGAVSLLAGSPGLSGGNDGTGGMALFSQPSGVAVDAAGNVYVADTVNSTIRKVTPAGVVTTIAGVAGTAGFGDGAGASALFNQPLGLVPDGSGGLYVVDTGNAAIRRLDASGMVTTLTVTAASAQQAQTPSSTTGGMVSPSTGSTSSTGATPSGGAGSTGGGGMSYAFVLQLTLLGAAGWTRLQKRTRLVRD